MDLACGLGGLGALFDGPGAALVLAVGQEGNQAQKVVGALDQPVQTGLLNAQIRQKHGPLLGIVQLGDILLQLGADRQHLRALLLRQLTDGPEIAVILVVGKAVLIHVGGVNNGLQAQQIRRLDDGAVVLITLESAGGLTGIQMGSQRLEHLGLAEELLVALGSLCRLLHAAVHHLQIRHDQLQINGADIAQRIHRHVLAGVRHHVHDVLIVEAAHYMNDGVGAADVLQELVAQARALTGALYQAGNVHELNDGGRLFVRLVHLCQLVQPRVRHGHHAHVGLNGAEGIVGAFGAGIGDGVEQGTLAHVGQPHDT